MPMFRKKPVLREAVQWHKPGDHPAVHSCVVPGVGESHSVRSANGRVPVAAGDYVVTEPDGRGHYPVKPDIFEAEYTPEDEG